MHQKKVLYGVQNVNRTGAIYLIGKVIRYNTFRESGIIYSFTNHRTYWFQRSNTIDDDIGYGYIVNFYVHYDEESGRRHAKDISVIECAEDDSDKSITKKKKKHSRHKSTNASKHINCNDKKFQIFVRDFMKEQKNKMEEKA